jgi:hypothetical protein
MRPTRFSKNRRSLALPLALLLTSAVVCQPVLARSAQDPPRPKARDVHSAQARQQGKGKEYGPEANPGQVFKETKGRSALHSRGLEVRELHGKEAGKPISSMPGAKSITRGRWAEMKDIPKTGLYLVDMDHIPPGLDEDLKSNGYRLAADGTLTRDGNPVALFVHGETFHVKPERAVRKPGGGGSSASLPSDPPEDPNRSAKGLADWAGRALLQLAEAAESLISSEAYAAEPFPWRCGTWYFKWEYNGGFCRNYKAWSNAYAWGPGADGHCANPKPLTHIEYISTYVTAAGKTDWDYHYNADQSHSYVKRDYGCFWPAIGGTSGFHYAYWRDGSAWMYRTWSW